MSLTHSPNTVTSGLVFNYDMNSIRSFKGAPTTNLVSNAATMSGFSNYGSGPVSTFVTEFGTTGWRMNSAGSWNGTLTGITIPTTGTYTFSAWYRYWGGSDNNNGATCYVTGWGGGDSAATIDKSKIGQWQRISITLNVTTASCTLYLISYGGTNGADNSTWDVTMPQVEAGSFATPWVDGSRSNTQALLDLTNTYTLTPTNLSYSPSGTFAFTGSSYIDLNSSNIITGNNPFTVEAWYTTTGTTADEIFGNYGAATSGTLWISGRYGTYINGSVYFPGAPIGAGTYHLMTTRNAAGNVILYLNGNQVNAGVLSASIPVGFNFRIGADVNGGAEPFTGNIYSVKVYNRVLSAAEVQQNFNAMRGRYVI
jgi:hypothetical protein